VAPATQPKKLSKGGLIALIIAAVIGCIISIVILVSMLKTESAQGTVSQVAWQRALVIEAYTQVQGQAWYDEIPAGADLGSCSMRYRNTSSEPVVNATEVCGEPYTIDTGTGVGEVVQDCTYEVYADYCSYSGFAWTVVDEVTTSGNDLSPYWPNPSLTSSQRVSDQKESYVIYFDVDGQQYPYATSDLNLFQDASIGSTWQLEINGAGNVTSVLP
jgi:type II secretory pathway pseudopilin PulG